MMWGTVASSRSSLIRINVGSIGDRDWGVPSPFPRVGEPIEECGKGVILKKRSKRIGLMEARGYSGP